MPRQFGHYPGAMSQGQQIAFTNSAAAWAAGGSTSSSRFAMLRGNRLLLFSDQGLRTVRLDLPFASVQAQATGTFLGVAGDRAFLLGGEALSAVNLDSGKAESILFAPGENVGGDNEAGEMFEMSGFRFRGSRDLRAAIGGSLIYVSESNGISAWNSRTRQRVFQASWPKSVAPAARTTTQPEQFNYLAQGRIRYINGQYGSIEPVTALVADGAFYVESEPGRLVALVNEKGAPAP